MDADRSAINVQLMDASTASLYRVSQLGGDQKSGLVQSQRDNVPLIRSYPVELNSGGLS